MIEERVSKPMLMALVFAQFNEDTSKMSVSPDP